MSRRVDAVPTRSDVATLHQSRGLRPRRLAAAAAALESTAHEAAVAAVGKVGTAAIVVAVIAIALGVGVRARLLFLGLGPQRKTRPSTSARPLSRLPRARRRSALGTGW